MTEDFATRVFNLLKRRKESGVKLTKDQLADELGCSRTMLYNYELGDPPPPPGILSTMSILERRAGIEHLSSSLPQEEPISYRTQTRNNAARLIKIIGWAHAGEAESYEEIPGDWQENMATDCRKEKAFGVRLEGDSMEPKFCDGDVLIVMPLERAYSGCYAVVKFKNDGVLFRRLEMNGQLVRLMPLNGRYSASEHAPDEFAWIYPVWGRFTQMWKR
jgi:SOS-response transcriptional repressor LexA